MQYKISAEIDIAENKFKGRVQYEREDMMPSFILKYVKDGYDTIDKLKEPLKPLSENRVKVLLYILMDRYGIIELENDNIVITDIGEIYLQQEKSFEPKFGNFIEYYISNTTIPVKDNLIDIKLDKELTDDEEIQEDYENMYFEKISNKNSPYLGKSVIESYDDYISTDKISCPAEIENDKITVKSDKFDYQSEIDMDDFEDNVIKQIKEYLYYSDYWSDDDDAFIPDEEMLKKDNNILANRDNFKHTINDNDMELSFDYNDEENEKYNKIILNCSSVSLSSMKIAPDENTSEIWFLYMLDEKITRYKTEKETMKIIDDINMQLSNYTLYEQQSRSVEDIADYYYKKENYQKYRYIQTALDLPIQGF